MRPDAHHFVRPDWRRFVRPGFEHDHPFALYERKYSPDQARDDHGRRTSESGGGASVGGTTNNAGNGVSDSTDGSVGNTPVGTGESADVKKILDMAKRFAARGYSPAYLKCLDICYPILNRPQPPGADFNENDFHKCLRACMGRK